MTLGTADGVDNDGDGTVDEPDEVKYYSLTGRHVDGIGFTVRVENEDGRRVELQNKCFYASTFFANLDDPFCLNTPPFEIKLGELNNGAGNTINVMVNGVNTNIFDAGSLGIGSYVVMATYDAGQPGYFRFVNGVPVDGSEADALANPGCLQKITDVVQVVATPATLVCNDLVHVSVDADCESTIYGIS